MKWLWETPGLGLSGTSLPAMVTNLARRLHPQYFVTRTGVTEGNLSQNSPRARRNTACSRPARFEHVHRAVGGACLADAVVDHVDGIGGQLLPPVGRVVVPDGVGPQCLAVCEGAGARGGDDLACAVRRRRLNEKKRRGISATAAHKLINIYPRPSPLRSGWPLCRCHPSLPIGAPCTHCLRHGDPMHAHE
jgi:hypothetical protein